MSTNERFIILLKEHLVLGLPTMPGVMALELAMSAAQRSRSRRPCRITGVTFHRPLCLTPNASLKTRVQLDDDGAFRLSSGRTATNGNVHWTEHVSAIVHEDTNGESPFFDLAEAAGRCQRAIDIEKLYKSFHEAGLSYGPQFQTIVSARCGDRDVVAELRLSPQSEPDAKQFRLHPCLLDGALQSIGCLALNAAATSGEVYLPYGIEEVIVCGEVNGPAFCHARVLDTGTSVENSRANVTITDKTGHVLLRLNGVAFKRVPLTSSRAKPAFTEWLYRRTWNAGDTLSIPAEIPRGPWLVFRDSQYDGGLSDAFIVALRDGGAHVVEVSPGEDFVRRGPLSYSIPPARAESFDQLIAALQHDDRMPTRVIHAWNVRSTQVTRESQLKEHLDRGVLSVFHLSRSLSANRESGRTSLTVVSSNSHAVANGPCLNPENGAVWGLMRVVALECPSLSPRCIDIHSSGGLAQEARLLLAECINGELTPEVVHSGGRRWMPIAEPLAHSGAAPSKPPIVEDGVYVVTGGMGGIGLEVARWLARGRRVKVALFGRSVPDTNSPGPVRSALDEIRALGSDCSAISVDVGDATALAAALDRVRRELGPIRGVFHAAGCIKDQLLRNKQEDAFRDVLRPKTLGTYNLDRLTRTDPLDFLVLFSSIVSYGGNVGQCDYAAANRYMDCLAAWRNEQGLRTIAIEWGPWAEVGMAVRLVDASRSAGIEPLPTESALSALEAVLSTREACVAVAALSESARARFGMAAGASAAVQAAPVAGEGATPAAARANVEEVEELLTAEMSVFLEIGADYIDREASFAEMGIDSIMAADLLRELENQNSIKLSPTIFFEATNIASLAAILANSLTPDNVNLWSQRRGRKTPPAAAQSIPTPSDPIVPLETNGSQTHLAASATTDLLPQSDAELRGNGGIDPAQVANLVMEELANYLEIDVAHVTADCELSELGLDAFSLGIVLERIETLSEAQLPHRMLIEASSVSALTEQLAHQLTPQRLDAWRVRRDNAGPSSKERTIPIGVKESPAPAPCPTPAPILDDDGCGAPNDATVEPMATRESRPMLATAAGDVAVIGYALRFPGANDAERFWENLRLGVRSLSKYSDARRAYLESLGINLAELDSICGGFVSDYDCFDPHFFGIPEAEAAQMDPQHRLFLETCWHALESAGYAGKRSEGTRTGVFAGLCGYSQYAHQFLDQMDEVTGAFIIGNTTAILANRVSYLLNLTGPSLSLDTACSSSLVAAHLAMQSLLSNECEMALVGGVNLLLLPQVFVAFQKAGMLAPGGQTRPLDSHADGFARGDGCGVMLIKPLEAALRDRDRIHAIVKGSAVNQDGRTNGLMAPNLASQTAVIAEAYRRADIDPRSVTYVELQGTASTIGDAIEMRALTSVFQVDGKLPRQSCAIGSVKANVGHLEIASGMSSLLKVILSLSHRQLPPALGLREPNPHILFEETPFYVNDTLQGWDPRCGVRRAGVNCFGFGGTNAHVILEEPPVQLAPVNAVERPLHLLCLSGDTPEAVRTLAGKYADLLERTDAPVLSNICYTAATGRRHMAHRIAVAASSSLEMAAHLRSVTGGTPSGAVKTGHVTAKRRARIGFLFTGQGAQYPGMGRELYETQPTFRKTIDQADEILRGILERPLLAVLYGAATDTALLKETCYTQPALFAIEYALAELWRTFGVEPAAVLGHSIGEYVAACVAGVFDFETGLSIVAERGKLLQSLPQTGSMAVALCPEAHVREALRNYNGSVSIAATNGPQNTVLSGDREAVERIVATLGEFGVTCRPLNVSHAFHSQQVEPVLDAFERVIRNSHLCAPRIPVISNVTAEVLSDGDACSPEYWRRHLREPVRFADGLLAMRQLGCGTFLEAGPQATLIGMGRRVIEMPDAAWFPSLAQGRSDWATLLSSVGDLYAAGFEIDWNGFDSDYVRSRVPLPTYPFERRRYWGKVSAPAPSATGSVVPMPTPTLDADSAIESYGRYARPLLARQLHLGKLDKCFHRARGNTLWYMTDGTEVEVLDLVGGYGAGLFGHNHPELVECAHSFLEAGRPVQAQASVRGEAALLCREMSEQLQAYTGEDYITTLLNSGAEAVEAALRHAEMKYVAAAMDLWLKMDKTSALLAHEYRNRTWSPGPELHARLCAVIGEDAVRGAGVEQLVSALQCHNEQLLSEPPVVLALHGAFHGRTRGAASLTACYDSDAAVAGAGRSVLRIEIDDPAGLDREVRAHDCDLWQLRLGTTGEPTLMSQPWSRIVGLFVEPVQGEGGVRPLPRAFVSQINALAAAQPFPVIVDEIQAGFGRCGAFTASEALGLRGNYFIFGKSLGGGLAKTAALCVERRRYHEPFGSMHTSTFGEDDLSSGIARRALQIVRRDDVAGRCAAIGNRFTERLRALQRKYPSVIADVRGLGCMIGVELCDTASSPSSMLRLCGQAIGYMAAGFLLNEERVRVLPTSSSPRTLRIQPSAYLGDAEMDRCVNAFDRLCRVIEYANAGRLLRYMLHPDSPGPAEIGDWRDKLRAPTASVKNNDPSVAFVVYFVDGDHLLEMDPSLAEFPPEEREDLVRVMSRSLEPGVSDSHRIQSITGDFVNVHIIGVMVTSRIVEEAWRSGDSDWVVELLQKSVDLACTLGCQTIGFAGFLSIASYNCKKLATSRIGLTTGNALTVATGIESLRHQASRIGIDVASSTLGIVGATGNISSTYAQIMANDVGAVVLIGRPGAGNALDSVAAVLYENAWNQIQSTPVHELRGIAAKIASTDAFRRSQNGSPPSEPVGKWLHRNISAELGQMAPVTVSESLDALKRCNLIVTASNASEAILFDYHLGPGPIVICDIAVPPDLSPSVGRNRPDVVVTSGGCVRIPLAQSLDLPGIDLPRGNIYACEAETVVLGLERREGHYSFGPLASEDVAEISAIAKRHGFVLGDDVKQSGGQVFHSS